MPEQEHPAERTAPKVDRKPLLSSRMAVPAITDAMKAADSVFSADEEKLKSEGMDANGRLTQAAQDEIRLAREVLFTGPDSAHKSVREQIYALHYDKKAPEDAEVLASVAATMRGARKTAAAPAMPRRVATLITAYVTRFEEALTHLYPAYAKERSGELTPEHVLTAVMAGDRLFGEKIKNLKRNHAGDSGLPEVFQQALDAAKETIFGDEGIKARLLAQSEIPDPKAVADILEKSRNDLTGVTHRGKLWLEQYLKEVTKELSKSGDFRQEMQSRRGIA